MFAEEECFEPESSSVDEVEQSSQIQGNQTLIIDAGSGMIKAGFAGEEYPQCCFHNVVGIPKCETEEQCLAKCQYFSQQQQNYKYGGDVLQSLKPTLGLDAIKDKAKLVLYYPMERGIIKNMDMMTIIYQHIFKELGADPEETKVLISEPIWSQKTVKEDVGHVLFEILGVPAISFMNQGVLSLYSTGRTSGLVVDSGDQMSYSVSIYDGYLIPHTLNTLQLGGRDVTENIQRLMYRCSYDFNTSAEHHIMREMKESGICYVSLDFESEMKKPQKELMGQYQLPDGQKIIFSDEIFRCTEIMFQPHLVGKEVHGIADMAINTFQKSHIDVRSALYSSVVLVGGNTLLPGFTERLQKDMSRNSFKKFILHADETRQFSAWMGGSILGSLSSFNGGFITIDQYNEEGSAAFDPNK